MAYSNLFNESNTNIIINRLDKYNPDDFFLYEKDDVVVLEKGKNMNPLDLFKSRVAFTIANSGLFTASPFAFNLNQHREIYSILEGFSEMTSDISLSSCRIDAINRDPKLADAIRLFNPNKLTVAVEGISERICNFLQKSLLTDELVAGTVQIIKRFPKLKFYYIYTGLENEKDLVEFCKYLSFLRQIALKYDRSPNSITFSFTPLCSTPGTPLAYFGPIVSEAYSSKFKMLSAIHNAVASYGFSSRLSTSIGTFEVQQLMYMGDRRSKPAVDHLSLCGISNQVGSDGGASFASNGLRATETTTKDLLQVSKDKGVFSKEVTKHEVDIDWSKVTGDDT